MPRIQYVVVQHQGKWTVSVQHKYYGSFDTQKQAYKQAVDWAHEQGKLNHDSQVLIQGTDGKFRTEWTYGHDPYPPKG